MTHSFINTTAITVRIQVKLLKIIYLTGSFSLTAKLQNRSPIMHFDAFELLNVLAGPLCSLTELLNIINNSCVSSTTMWYSLFNYNLSIQYCELL